MSEQSLWQRTIAAIHREYERRIRRASLVTEYGAAHHGDHDHHAEEAHAEDDGAEIVNVPKGTRLGRQARPAPPSEPDHPSTP